MRNYIYIFVLACFWCSCTSKSIKPGEQWFDNNGEVINAHGGGMLFSEGKYYWFGVNMHAGATSKVGVGVYSSENLVDWTNEGVALSVSQDPNSDITSGCLIERPKVVYNKATEKFVMWFHLELAGQGYDAARTGLAVSDNVEGPYTFVKSLRPNAGEWPMNFTEAQKHAEYPINMGRWSKERSEAIENGMFTQRDFHGGQMCRDMTLFVDDDGVAYHIAASEENATLQIRELTDDYLGFTGRYTRVFANAGNEAPAVVKHDGKYYMIASGCTGWKPNPGRSGVADSMLGKWTNLGNPFKGTEEGEQTSFHSQPTYIIHVQGKENAYIYMGDRWNPENLIDSRYIWLPLYFEEGKPIIRWIDEWTLDDL